MIPLSQDWLKDQPQLLSTQVRIAGALDGEGTEMTAGLALSTLAAEVSPAPGPHDTGLWLAGITYAKHWDICSNKCGDRWGSVWCRPRVPQQPSELKFPHG